MKTMQFKTNLNCETCVAAVKPYLDAESSIRDWSVNTDDSRKTLTVHGRDVSEARIQELVAAAGFKVLDHIGDDLFVQSLAVDPILTKSFFATYKPLLLLVGYLLGGVGVAEFHAGEFQWGRAMNHFMGGFFLAFSFFKMLDLQGFADSFQSYDIVARPYRAWGFIYPFVELALGLAYLAELSPVVTNTVTLTVMLVGIIGVSQALFQKRKIQCACLGTVFNLPMSKVTFIEDGVMAVMAGFMLWSVVTG